MKLDDAKGLRLEDKSLFDDYFKQYPPQISELTFTNLYIWRHHYEFRFLEWKGHLILFSEIYLSKWRRPLGDNNKDKEVIFFLPPIGPSPAVIIMELFNEVPKMEVHRVPTTILNNLRSIENYETSHIKIQEDKNNWDYVYDLKMLKNLPKNKLRQKRRNLESFLGQYEYKFQKIDEETLGKTRKLQIEWCDMNECQANEDLEQEQKAINEIFNHFHELDVIGALICVDDGCVAYTLGEMLNKDTLVIHIEKAHIHFEGSYQAINNLFLKHCAPSEATFVNREQDLGIPGLRRAKKAYKPVKMIEKSILYKINP